MQYPIQPASEISRSILQQMAARGEIHLPALRQVDCANRYEERTYYRKNEIIEERVSTRVEVFYFD